jgi:tetratricopeptide (TPR) repeat protein
LGETHRAIEFYEQALPIDREIGYRRGEGAALGNLGIAYRVLGETRRAIESYEQALTIAREIGDRHGEGNHLGNLGSAYFTLGETRQAIEFYEQALVISHDIGDKSGQSYWLLGVASVYQAVGDMSQAHAHAEQSLALDMPETAYSAALMLGILAVQSGDRSCSAQYFDLALAKCHELLDKTPELYEVLYAYGTALAGQAVVSGQSSMVVFETYQRAINIFAGPTILKDTLRDLRYLQSADCEGLEPVIELLERHIA